MTTFKVGARVTPVKTDSKLGSLHGVSLIVAKINEFKNTIAVKSEDGKYLIGSNFEGDLRFSPTRSEYYHMYRFELIEAYIETIEDRIKKLYRKCKTTAHWA